MATQILGSDGVTLASVDSSTLAQKVVVVNPLGSEGYGSQQLLAQSLGSLNASTTTMYAGGAGSGTIQVTGTFSGTITLQGTIDGTNWQTINIYPIATPVLATTLTAVGVWEFKAQGFTQVRATMTAYTSGTAVVSLKLSPAPFVLANSAIASSNYTRVTDGTNTQAVKAASTAAAATDPASVVTLSPNLPVPTVHTLESAATTNATSVKGSAGRITALVVTSPLITASVRYLKLYNKASAPTVGTDVPVATIPIVTTTNGVNVFSLQVSDLGLYFSTGIAYAITGASTTADATAVAAGDVKVMMNYI